MSLVNHSIWTFCSLRVSFNSHCFLMSFVSSSCKLSVVSGTVESVSSHLLCWGFLGFLPPLFAEVLLNFFPALCAGIWHSHRLHLSHAMSACGAVGGCCFSFLGNHPLPSFSLMCTRYSSSWQSIYSLCLRGCFLPSWLSRWTLSILLLSSLLLLGLVGCYCFLFRLLLSRLDFWG